MTTPESLKLLLNDATMEHAQHELSLGAPNKYWADWVAQYMSEHGYLGDAQQLATLLREADAAYHNEPEQSPWLQYISDYVTNELE